MTGPVRFDHARAARAVAALEHLARMVDDHAAARARLGTLAAREWRGRHACSFAAEQADLARHAAALAAELRREARRIAAAAEWARAEQRRWEAERLAGRETGAPWGARL
jgi:uncharacterized protein YukE